jgi:hypothetical protein
MSSTSFHQGYSEACAIFSVLILSFDWNIAYKTTKMAIEL